MRVLQLAPGVQATAGAASSTTAIPVDSSGVKAKLVLIRVITASELAVVRAVENSGDTVTAANGVPVIDSHEGTLLWTAGKSYIAHIRGRSNNCVFNITPVENY